MSVNTTFLPIALLLIAAVFEGYCLVDLARAPQVRMWPREVWALLMVLTIPIGGILYLRYGKVR